MVYNGKTLIFSLLLLIQASALQINQISPHLRAQLKWRQEITNKFDWKST